MTPRFSWESLIMRFPIFIVIIHSDIRSEYEDNNNNNTTIMKCITLSQSSCFLIVASPPLSRGELIIYFY